MAEGLSIVLTFEHFSAHKCIALARPTVSHVMMSSRVNELLCVYVACMQILS